MSAKDDWPDGISIADGWWNTMSAHQKMEYRQSNDRKRRFMRQDAKMELFGCLYDGVIVAVGRQLLDEEGKVDKLAYIDRRYFRNFDLFDPKDLTRLVSVGAHFKDIRVKFPEEWIDAETYHNRGEFGVSATLGVSHAPRTDGQQRRRTSGRASQKDTIRSVVVRLMNDGVINSNRAQKRSAEIILKELGQDPDNPLAGYSIATIKRVLKSEFDLMNTISK